MIKTFKNRQAENVFLREAVLRLSQKVYRIALRKLLLLDAADRIEDLRVPPGNRLEKLAGDRKGLHSLHINDQWRLCFRWQEGDAYEVEIVDYH